MNRKRTMRDEANALTCYAFRNGKLEDLHAGKRSPLLDDPTLSRITDAEMKELMIDASAKLAEALLWKETDPERYWKHIDWLCETYTRNWVKDEPVCDGAVLSKGLIKDISTRLSRELGRPVTEAEVEAAVKRIVGRHAYDLDSRENWIRLFSELDDEVHRQGHG